MSKAKTLSPWRLTAGFLAGGAASSLVSPLVHIVDIGIMKVAQSGGKTTLLQALMEGLQTWLKSPSSQIRTFAFSLVWMVYAMTYASANTVKAVCEWSGSSPVVPNLIFVTFVNMATSMYKDAALAKAQKRKALEEGKAGNDKEEKQFPLMSWLLFLIRDILSVGAGFVFPPRISARLQARGIGAESAGVAAQLFSPAAIQIVALPFHFMALDVFNYPAAAVAERVGRLAPNYPNLVSIRMLRGVVNFGIGGVGNTRVLALLDK